jgi:hypothetical protein
MVFIAKLPKSQQLCFFLVHLNFNADPGTDQIANHK